MNLGYLSSCLFLGLVAVGLASCGSEPSAGGESGGQSGSSGTGGSNTGESSAGGSTNNPSTGGSIGNPSTGGSISSPSTGGSNSGGVANSVTGGSSAVDPGSGGSNSGGSTVDPGTGGSSTGGSGTVGTGGVSETGGGGFESTGGGLDAGGSDAGGSDAGGANQTGDGGSGSQIACSINVTTHALSTEIPTVGIVEWSTDLAGLTEAKIEFGLDTDYGMTAPVDLTETNYRTLILGMKAGGRTYHFRVVARAGDQICTGEDNALPPTGEPPNSLPLLTLTPAQADGLEGGFLVFETLKQTFGTGVPDSPVYIVDGDGDFVWWYTNTGIVDVGRARQSYDGKFMWISAVNVLSQQDRVIRVNMDGTGEQDFTSEFTELNHDFAVHPDGTIAFIAYGSNNCDDIKERSPDGIVTTIINSGDAVGASACHCNAIHYDRNDDTIVFSELETSSIVKVSRTTGQVLWLMSSQNSSNATVTGINWVNQHGMHIIDESHLLFFNNSTGPNATAIEVELSLNGAIGTATEVWSYSSDLTVQILGDAQRLSNGNTLITFSTAGEIREVNPAGTVLQTIKPVGSGNLFGFAEKRRSLYGPPPR